MAKTRKKTRKKTGARNQQTTTVHRYNAEAEDKKDSRKKLKIRGIVGLIAIAISGIVYLLVEWLVL